LGPQLRALVFELFEVLRREGIRLAVFWSFEFGGSIAFD
jgi:hypothetical protein